MEPEKHPLESLENDNDLYTKLPFLGFHGSFQVFSVLIHFNAITTNQRPEDQQRPPALEGRKARAKTNFAGVENGSRHARNLVKL